jgi:hypothetical protein
MSGLGLLGVYAGKVCTGGSDSHLRGWDFRVGGNGNFPNVFDLDVQQMGGEIGAMAPEGVNPHRLLTGVNMFMSDDFM